MGVGSIEAWAGFCRAEGRTQAARVCADRERDSEADYKSQRAARPRLPDPAQDWSIRQRSETGRLSTGLRKQPTGTCSFLESMYQYRKVLLIILREKFRNIPVFGREPEWAHVVVSLFLLFLFGIQP